MSLKIIIKHNPTISTWAGLGGTVVSSYNLNSLLVMDSSLKSTPIHRTDYPITCVLSKSLKVKPTLGKCRPWPTTVVAPKKK